MANSLSVTLRCMPAAVRHITKGKRSRLEEKRDLSTTRGGVECLLVKGGADCDGALASAHVCNSVVASDVYKYGILEQVKYAQTQPRRAQGIR